jgi:hypothetical protein
MITVRIISLCFLFLYVLHASFGNFLPPKNPLAKRILLSILIGFAIQLLIIPNFIGYILLFLLDNSLKAGAPDDWRLLIVNMLLYGTGCFLILTAIGSGNRQRTD